MKSPIVRAVAGAVGAAVAAGMLTTLTCCRQKPQPEKTTVEAGRTTPHMTIAEGEILTRDYSNDAYFLAADRIRGDLAQQISGVSAVPILVAAFYQHCGTPLDGATEEKFLFEVDDATAPGEEAGATVRLSRQFDVGDRVSGALQLSMEMKFAPDAPIEQYRQAKWFASADEMTEYVTGSDLMVAIVEQGLTPTQTKLRLFYTG